MLTIVVRDYKTKDEYEIAFEKRDCSNPVKALCCAQYILDGNQIGSPSDMDVAVNTYFHRLIRGTYGLFMLNSGLGVSYLTTDIREDVNEYYANRRRTPA